MSNHFSYENILPIAPLKVAALEGCRGLAEDVDRFLAEFRQNSNQGFQDIPQPEQPPEAADPAERPGHHRPQ